MNFKQFFLMMEVSVHAKTQLEDRLRLLSKNNPDLLPNPEKIIQEIEQNMEIAEKIYNIDGKSFAVEIYQFPFSVSMSKDYNINHPPDIKANVDMCIAVLKPHPINTTELNTVTFMFRQLLTLPFTPAAFGVDEVVRYNEFLRDKRKLQTPKRFIKKYREMPELRGGL